MLTISKPMSASAAIKYHFGDHAKTDYYTQTAGTWFGKGAETLGLTGEVNEKDFASITAGINPEDGKRLIQAKTKNGELQHVAGVDMVMSIPKSASILSLGDPKINEILEVARNRTLAAAEKYAAQCRYVDPETGKQVPVNSGNLVVAQFHHMTSRENEPQNHWHCFIMNMTQRADGKWVALHNRELYQMQRALGRVFDNELVYELRKAGYEIRITDVEKGTWEIVGVSKELIDEMSTRAKQVEAKMEELRQDPRYANKTEAELREDANLLTRKDKEEVNHDILKADWDERFQKYGYTAASLAKEITTKRDLELARREAELVAGIVPVKEHVSVAIDRGTEMAHMSESAFTMGDVFDNSMKPVLGDHSITEYEAEIAAGEKIVSMGYYTDHKGNRAEYFSTPEMIRQEQWMVDTTMELKGTFTPSATVTVERCNDFLSRQEAQGRIYSPSQRAVFIEILTGKDGVLLNPGYAGTGKTTLREAVQAFNEELKTAGEPQHRVIGAGFTGKAAKELADRGVAASTVDSFLRKDLQVQELKDLQAVAQKNDPLLTSEVVITDGKAPEEETPGKIYLNRRDCYEVLVDEASMLSSQHLYKIMQRVVDLREQGIQVKITLSGDDRQAVAIGAGRMFHDLQHFTDTANVGLTDIIRQKAGTYAYEVSTTLYRQELDPQARMEKVMDILGANGMVSEIADKDALIQQSANDYFELIEGKGSGFIVTVTNKERKDLNAAVRQMRVDQGIIEQGETFQILTAASLGKNQILAVDNYKVEREGGRQIVYTGELDEEGKVIKEPERVGRPQPGYVGKFISADPATNSMTVLYRDKRGREFLCEHSLKEDWNKISSFVQEEREFSVGDKIVFLKNDKLLGVDNGTLGTVVKIQDGQMIVQLGEKPEGKLVRFAVDGREGKGRIPYQYIDHAYAVTIEKSQGASVDVVITHAFVKALEKENSAGALAEALGKNVTPEVFNSFNTTLTPEEKDWAQNFTLRLGKGPEHEVTASVILANVGVDGVDVQKAVMLEFSDPQKIIADEATREKMRDAGMFFDETNGVWLTSLTNSKAEALLGEAHPLRTEYLNIAKNAVELHAQNLGIDLAENAKIIDASASVANAVGGGWTENKALVGFTRGKSVMKHNTNDIKGFVKGAAIASYKFSTVGHWDKRTGKDFIDAGRRKTENPEWEVYNGEKKAPEVKPKQAQAMTAIINHQDKEEEFSTKGMISQERISPEEKLEVKPQGGVLHRTIKGKDGEWVNEIVGVNTSGSLVHLRLPHSQIADFTGTIKRNGPSAAENHYQKVYEAKLQAELNTQFSLPGGVEAGLRVAARNEAVQRYLDRHPSIRQEVTQGELLAHEGKTSIQGHVATVSVVQDSRNKPRVALAFDDKRIAGDHAARDLLKAEGFRFDRHGWTAPLAKGQNLLGEVHPLRAIKTPERQAVLAEKLAAAATKHDAKGGIDRAAEAIYVREKGRAVEAIPHVKQKPEFHAAHKAAQTAAMLETGIKAVISDTRGGSLRVDELKGRAVKTSVLDPAKQPKDLAQHIEKRNGKAEEKVHTPEKEQKSEKMVAGDLQVEKKFEIPEAKGSDFATPAEKHRTAMDLPFAKGIETGTSRKHDFTAGGTGVQWEREGLFKFGDRSMVRGHTDRGYGEFNTRIKKETRYIQTGANKGTVTTSKIVSNEAHSTTDRTVKRTDGTKVESKEYGYRTDIGYSLKQKDEVIKDASGEKIGRQKSTTHSFGGQVWGTKKIYGKDGSVKVVKWRGHYTFSGKLKIDKQTIETETNKKAADRALKPLGQRIVNAVAEKLAINTAKKDVNQQRAQDLVSKAIEYEKGKGHDSDVKSKRVEQGGRYKQEDTITRKDGSVIKAVEKGETIGSTKKSVRVETIEKGENYGAKKIVETNRTGNVMIVKTKEVSRFGKIKETEWHGLKQADGTFKTVGKPLNQEYTDIAAAKKVLMTVKERILDKVLQTMDKVKETTKSAEKSNSNRELSKGGMSL